MSEESLFEAEFFRRNRDRLRQAFSGKAPIVISAHGLVQKSRDEAYPFAQESNFWYLTGVDESDVVLVMDKDSEFLILPDRDQRYTTFCGELDAKQINKISGVADVFDHSEGWRRLSGRLKRAKHVATLKPLPVLIDSIDIYSNPSGLRLVSLLKDKNPDLQLIDLRPHLANLRMVKSAEEIKAIKSAVDKTAAVFQKIGKKLSTYKTEDEIFADLKTIAIKENLDFAYPPIIAGGKNATTLHYEKNNQPLPPQQPLLLDFGFARQKYCADITRTVCLNPTKRQQDIYDAVLAVWEYAIDQLQPGIKIMNYEKKVRHFMGEKLRELGLISVIDEAEVAKYYPHATSHFLGLDAHDPMDPDKGLEPGTVLTVEPGIYIAEESIGIRLEDTVLITKDGCQVLSAKLPKSLGSITIKPNNV